MSMTIFISSSSVQGKFNDQSHLIGCASMGTVLGGSVRKHCLIIVSTKVWDARLSGSNCSPVVFKCKLSIAYELFIFLVSPRI